MGNALIAFLVSISAATWLYAKFMRKSGNNAQTSIIAVAVLGIFVFIISLLLLNMFVPSE